MSVLSVICPSASTMFLWDTSNDLTVTSNALNDVELSGGWGYLSTTGGSSTVLGHLTNSAT